MSNAFISYGPNLRVLPIIHHRIVFSQLLISGLADAWRPEVLAIELPSSVSAAIIQGLARKVLRGSLWVGRRVRDAVEATSLNQLTGTSTQ